jgi:hypothetical protein
MDTASLLVEYKKYASEMINKGLDFELFSEWKEILFG